MEKNQDTQTPAAAADLTTFLIASLGLSPAEGAEAVSEDQIREALTAAIAAGQEAAAGADNVSTLQSQLNELQAKYDAAAGELAGLKAGAVEKEIDGLLEPYSDIITDDAARTAMRELLATNRDAGMALLKGMKPAASVAGAPGTTDLPPPPMHDPARDGEKPAQSPEQNLAEINRLVAELRKERPQVFKTYDDAHNEVRRTRPELFS